MKNSFKNVLPYPAGLLFICLILSSCSNQQKHSDAVFLGRSEVPKRSESFFGIHFDLHAHEDNNVIGETLTYEMLDTFLFKVKPDFVQIDCKGHPGISSYPTEVGFRAAHYYNDPMKIWREVTLDHKVALYVHYSGMYDRKAAKEYPEWAIINKNGEKDAHNLSVYSPYSKKLLIPQLIELSDKYKIDGAWIDGECWSVMPDYSKDALEEFMESTGIRNIPRSPSDANYVDFMKFNRKLFKRYVSEYVDAIHKHNPEFQITSNWAFSSLMPGKVDIDLDFLSGDLQAQNSVYSAAFEARCLAPQGKPWDLMAWSFAWSPAIKMQNNTKSPLQLKQEASQVIAMGGGIQFYFKQNPDLSIQPWTTGIMADLAEFCREREPYCFKAKQIPQVGLIFSTEAFEEGLERVYSGGWTEPIAEPLKGSLNILLDGQYSVEVLMEHHLENRMSEYPLLVWPEWNYISDDFRNQLLNYVNEGGNLLVTGPEAIKLFSKELAIDCYEPNNSSRYVPSNGRMVVAGSHSLSIKTAQTSEIKKYFYKRNDFRFKEDNPAAFITPYGKGKIAAICFDAGQAYFDWHHFVIRDFVSEIVYELFPEPKVQISGSSHLHMVLNEKNGFIQLNITNVSGDHANKGKTGFDELQSIGPVQIKLKSDKKPKEIIAIPGNRSLTYKYLNGSIEFELPVIDINTILIVKT